MVEPSHGSSTYSAKMPAVLSGRKALLFFGGRGVRARLQLQAQAGPGIGPVFVSRGAAEAEECGGFLDRQAAEIAELHQPSRLRVLGGELRQGLIDGEDLVVVGQVARVGV